MKEKILNLILIVSMMATGVSAFSHNVKASNTTDTTYAFSNANSVGYCEWRSKEDYSRVYVHPTSGPAIYYTVQGKYEKNGIVDALILSGKHKIYVNTYASIVNYVKENNCSGARLKFDVVTSSPVDTVGVWSPDSTKNFTVYY